MSTVALQVFLFVTLFSDDAFNFALDMTSALTLIPFLLAAAYALKVAVTREAYAGETEVVGASGVATLATVYTAFLLFAAGLKFVLRVVHHLCPGHRPVRDGPPRAGPPVLPGRGRAARRLDRGAVVGIVAPRRRLDQPSREKVNDRHGSHR